MKRNEATKQAIEHADQSNKKHQDDVKRSKALQARRKAELKKGIVWEKREVADGVEKGEYPDFKSNVSGLGIGECFDVSGGITLGASNAKVEQVKLVVEDGAAWRKKLDVAMRALARWHVLQPRESKKGKDGKKDYWVPKKSRDRVKVKKGEKQRPASDVSRETVDLRPDSSRAVQYLVEAGKLKEVNEALDAIRLKKIELFERIYGRKVLYCSEHTDSGQHHDDLWHTGVFRTGEKIGLIRKDGVDKRRDRIDRVEFHSYGIGVGASSWWRHMQALKEVGVLGDDLISLAGPTLKAIDNNTFREEGRHGKPRDLEFLEELDSFVTEKLSGLDKGIFERARGEYGDWLKKGYAAGMVGFKKSEKEVLLEKIDSLETRLELSERNFDSLVKSVKVVFDHLGHDILAKVQNVSMKLMFAAGEIARAVGIRLPEAKLEIPSIEAEKLPSQPEMKMTKGKGKVMPGPTQNIG